MLMYWEASPGFSRTSFNHHVISSCNLLVNIKVLESTLVLFRPLTKLPHPNTIYRYIGPGIGSWVLALEHVLSRAKGATYTFASREGGVQNFTGHPWPKRGRKQRVRYVLSRAKWEPYTFVSREGGVQPFTGYPWPKGDGKSE